MTLLELAAKKYLSRLLITYSDLCDTDEDIAACLELMRVAPPAGEAVWTARLVRSLIPEAFGTVCSASEYTNQPNHQTVALCAAVFSVIKNRKEQ